MSDGPQLIVFGCLTTDNVVTATGELLPEHYGGNCLYAALGARVWNDRVGVVSRYGAGYSEAPIELLRSLGVDTSGIRNLGIPHGRNVAFAYSDDGSRTRVFPPELIEHIPREDRARFIDTSLLSDAEERWQQFAPDGDDLPSGWWNSVAAVHCAYMPVAKHVQIAEAVRRKRGAAAWIQVDSPWHDARKPAIDYGEPLFGSIDALLPSEADVEAFRPDAPVGQTALALLDAGAKTVVLKLGPAGCQVFKSGQGLVAEVPIVARDSARSDRCGRRILRRFSRRHAHLERRSDRGALRRRLGIIRRRSARLHRPHRTFAQRGRRPAAIDHAGADALGAFMNFKRADAVREEAPC